MNTNRTTFLNSLNKSNVSSTVKDAILSRYDMLVDNFGDEGHDAAVAQYLPESVLMEAKAAIDCSPPNPEIINALTEANRYGVTKNPKTRLADYSKRHNRLIAGLQATLSDSRHSNVPIVSDTDKERLFLHFGETKAKHDLEFSSWASFKQNRANLN